MAGGSVASSLSAGTTGSLKTEKIFHLLIEAEVENRFTLVRRRMSLNRVWAGERMAP